MLGPCGVLAATCPPDGNEGLLPTFDAEDHCGSDEKCTALAVANQIEESKACIRKLDDCVVALNKANAEAEAHNAALEACRALIPNRQKTPSSPGQ
jgi:hypothetical protein